MFEWVFNLLNHPLTPWITTAIIPLWGIVLWFLLLNSYLHPLRQEIANTSSILNNTPTHPARFAAHFNPIDTHFSNLKLLSYPWNSFKGSIIYAQEPDLALLCGQRSETFFNITALAQYHHLSRLSQSAPTLLAGAGLLFTFLGLVGALYYASLGMITDDLLASQKALQGLLGTASFKFLASIAGFVSAAFFSWRVRHWHERISNDLERLNSLLSARLEFVTEERLSYDQLHATRQLQAQLHLAGTADNKTTHAPIFSLEPLTKAVREEGSKLTELLRSRTPPPEEAAAGLELLTATLKQQGDRLVRSHQSLLTKLEEQIDRQEMKGSLQDSQLLANIAAHLDLAANVLEQKGLVQSDDPLATDSLVEILRQDGTQVLAASHTALEQIATTMVGFEYKVQQSMQESSAILTNALEQAGQRQSAILHEIMNRVQTIAAIPPTQQSGGESMILREAAEQMARVAEVMKEMTVSSGMDALIEILKTEGSQWIAANNAALIKSLEGMGLASLPDTIEQAMQISSEALEDAVKLESQRLTNAHPEILEQLERAILRQAEERAGAETELLGRIAMQLHRAVEALERRAEESEFGSMELLSQNLRREGEIWGEQLGDRLERVARENAEEIRGTLQELMHWQTTSQNEHGGGGLSDGQIFTLINGLREEGESLATLHRQALEEVLVGMETVRMQMDGAFELSTQSIANALNSESERIIDSRPELLEHLESNLLMQAEARADAQSTLLGRITVQLSQAVEAMEEQVRQGPPIVELDPLIDALRSEIGHLTTVHHSGLERLMVQMEERLTTQSGDHVEMLSQLLHDNSQNSVIRHQESTHLDTIAIQLERVVMAMEVGHDPTQALTPIIETLQGERENLVQLITAMQSGGHAGNELVSSLIEGLRDEGSKLAFANETAMERVVLGLDAVANKIDRAFELSSETLTSAVERESARIVDGRPEILERLEAGILHQAESRMGAETELLGRIATQLERTSDALTARAAESDTLMMMLESLRNEGESWSMVMAERLTQGQHDLFSGLQAGLTEALGVSLERNDRLSAELLEQLEAQSGQALVKALTPLMNLLQTQTDQVATLQKETLMQMGDAFSTLENQLAEVMTQTKSEEAELYLNTESLQPFLDGLRSEGQTLARELGQHMVTTYPQPSGELQLHPAPLPIMARTEQESWMRIIDRMELAAGALEKQATGMDGLGTLATQMRQAGEGLIHSGQEAVATLLDSVADFNVKMEGMFARSADELLERLAQSHQEIVSQVINGLGEGREEEVGVFLKGVANQLETTITDSREIQQSSQLIMQPMLEGLRQEGERLLEAGDAAMRQTLSAVTHFNELLEASFQASMEQLTTRLTESQLEIGERLTTALSHIVTYPPVAPIPDASWVQEQAQQLDQTTKALESWGQTPPPPTQVEPSAPPPALPTQVEPSAPPPALPTQVAPSAPPPPSQAEQEQALEEMIVALKSHFPKLRHLDTTQIIKEAIERLNALLGRGDSPREIEAYPALMALRKEVAQILQTGQLDQMEPEQAELPRRIAALIHAWEAPASQPVKPIKPTAPKPVVKSQPRAEVKPVITNQPRAEVKPMNQTPSAPQQPKFKTTAPRLPVFVVNSPIDLKPEKRVPEVKWFKQSTPIMPSTDSVTTPLQPTRTAGIKNGENNFLPLVSRYLRQRQRPPFYLVKAIWPVSFPMND